MKKVLLYFCTSIFSVIMLCGSVSAEETSVHKFEKISAKQFKLLNGMTICLKPTEYEADEVHFKLAALGGYGAIKEDERPSGMFAAQCAWESGMGGMTSDQVSVFLYENAMEFEPKILPFSRVIEGEGEVESIECFLRCVQLLFTQHGFTKEGWACAKKETKDVIYKQANDYDHVCEAQFLKLNTHSLSSLAPMTLEDLSKAEFFTAKDIFRRSFSDPSEFVCVIVGNFDVDRVANLVEKHLGGIPRAIRNSGFNRPVSAPFPQGVTKEVIYLGSQPSSLTRITFPIKVKVDEGNIHQIAFICQIMEARFRNVITEKMELSYGVDVSYEFPVYPYLDDPWISVRFRCDQKDIDQIKGIVFSELGSLQVKGTMPEEVNTIKKLELGSQEFWLKDNFYWVSMLANYYLWGWNPERIDYKNTSVIELSTDDVNVLMKKCIDISNYSEFIVLPKK